MKNLFCYFYLLILIFKSSVCTKFDDCNVLNDDAQIISDLKDACFEPFPYEEEAFDDYEILECDGLPLSSNIVEDIHEVSDKKTNEIIKNPGEYLTKLIEELKKTFLLVNESLNHSILLNFIDKTIDLINCYLKASKNNVDDNIVGLKNRIERTTLNINSLDTFLKEIELLYEEKRKNLIYLEFDFRDSFIYIKGIIFGITKEFKRCLGSYENIYHLDNIKKINLLYKHQKNMVEMRLSISQRTECDVKKQVGFLKDLFFETIFLFYESLREIFETENRFFECHFKALDLIQKDIDECFKKLESLKKILA